MTLEELIRTCGEDWLIDWFAPGQSALHHMTGLIARANERLQEKFPGSIDVISEESLVAEYERSPHKVKAFLQAMGETESPDMLVMAWRLLNGAEVSDIELRYQSQKSFYLRVSLMAAEHHGHETYESRDIDDAAIFRHLGILKMNDAPVFDGFYALRR